MVNQHARAQAIVLTAVVAFSFPANAAAQYQETNTETLVSCPEVAPPQTLTAVEFAKGNLTGLWYARNAAERSVEMQEAGKKTDNWFSLLTAMMRIEKTSTNDFVCAKRSILPFAVGHVDQNIGTAAQMLVLVYRAHLDINGRALELLKKTDSLGPSELADELSTLQIERGQRWADLVQPTAMALLSLVDQGRIQNDQLPFLIVTKAEKKHLVGWALEKFPEFTNGTAKGKWSDPATTASLYLTLLNGRKCADEK